MDDDVYKRIGTLVGFLSNVPTDKITSGPPDAPSAGSRDSHDIAASYVQNCKSSGSRDGHHTSSGSRSGPSSGSRDAHGSSTRDRDLLYYSSASRSAAQPRESRESHSRHQLRSRSRSRKGSRASLSAKDAGASVLLRSRSERKRDKRDVRAEEKERSRHSRSRDRRRSDAAHGKERSRRHSRSRSRNTARADAAPRSERRHSVGRTDTSASRGVEADKASAKDVYFSRRPSAHDRESRRSVDAVREERRSVRGGDAHSSSTVSSRHESNPQDSLAASGDALHTKTAPKGPPAARPAFPPEPPKNLAPSDPSRFPAPHGAPPPSDSSYRVPAPSVPKLRPFRSNPVKAASGSGAAASDGVAGHHDVERATSERDAGETSAPGVWGDSYDPEEKSSGSWAKPQRSPPTSKASLSKPTKAPSTSAQAPAPSRADAQMGQMRAPPRPSVKPSATPTERWDAAARQDESSHEKPDDVSWEDKSGQGKWDSAAWKERMEKNKEIWNGAAWNDKSGHDNWNGAAWNETSDQWKDAGTWNNKSWNKESWHSTKPGQQGPGDADWESRETSQRFSDNSHPATSSTDTKARSQEEMSRPWRQTSGHSSAVKAVQKPSVPKRGEGGFTVPTSKAGSFAARMKGSVAAKPGPVPTRKQPVASKLGEPVKDLPSSARPAGAQTLAGKPTAKAMLSRSGGSVSIRPTGPKASPLQLMKATAKQPPKQLAMRPAAAPAGKALGAHKNPKPSPPSHPPPVSHPQSTMQSPKQSAHQRNVPKYPSKPAAKPAAKPGAASQKNDGEASEPGKRIRYGTSRPQMQASKPAQLPAAEPASKRPKPAPKTATKPMQQPRAEPKPAVKEDIVNGQNDEDSEDDKPTQSADIWSLLSM